jgi:hypothetical protein
MRNHVLRNEKVRNKLMRRAFQIAEKYFQINEKRENDY